ncbi:MAG: phenylalanine--tRNA ligase subunit alpha [Fusobacteria bacterium]|nr:phenylalanine--tRNA ligase subunit alpha [Fusobacteriota bacterium]
MKEKLLQLKEIAMEEVKELSSIKDIEDYKVKILGKKGTLTDVMKSMKDLSNEDRPVIGKIANEVRDSITLLLDEKYSEIKEIEKKDKIGKEFIDITLPGKKNKKGGFHPITETMYFMEKIFSDMGFDIADGPEAELIYYNFDALNIPQSHPSRNMQDTFYFNSNLILRTQTSPVQIRYMENKKPPFRMVCPGKVYRSDYDATHSPMFHQMEGLMIGKNISFANLKAILMEFVQKTFGDKKVRFRPHFFPFTEPSAEMDVEFVTDKGTKWLEIMGCGMVDPAVLKEVGIDPDEYTGFAFGMGIERIAMLRHGIDDLRAFFENDMRFLEQFK